MQISRRLFLQYAGALAGATAVTQSGLLHLKKLSPAEAEAMQHEMGKYTVKYYS